MSVYIQCKSVEMASLGFFSSFFFSFPPARWPANASEKPETDNWDAWAAQPSLTVPSAGQLRQRSAFTPATVTGSSPSPVLGQVSTCIH